MSELGYGSPKEIPSVLTFGGSNKIISYLVGSYVDHQKTKSFLYDLLNVFNYSSKDFVVAFTDDNIVIGELNRGNSSANNISLSYDEIKDFKYYKKSGDLEIVTDKNSRYVIKVAKSELNQSLKDLDKNLEVKYLEKRFKNN